MPEVTATFSLEEYRVLQEMIKERIVQTTSKAESDAFIHAGMMALDGALQRGYELNDVHWIMGSMFLRRMHLKLLGSKDDATTALGAKPINRFLEVPYRSQDSVNIYRQGTQSARLYTLKGQLLAVVEIDEDASKHPQVLFPDHRLKQNEKMAQ